MSCGIERMRARAVTLPMEARLFAGTPALVAGALTVDASRPGLGITLREEEIERHAA